MKPSACAAQPRLFANYIEVQSFPLVKSKSHSHRLCTEQSLSYR